MENLEVSCVFYRLIPLSKNFEIFFLDKGREKKQEHF